MAAGSFPPPSARGFARLEDPEGSPCGVRRPPIYSAAIGRRSAGEPRRKSRPGKAPVTLIRRRFADDIKSEVLQSLVPEQIERAVTEQKMVPVTRPEVDKVDFAEAGPVKFRATFEVLPDFELGAYKDLEVEVEDLKVEDADVDKGLEELRDRAATFVPVEGRAIADVPPVVVP